MPTLTPLERLSAPGEMHRLKRLNDSAINEQLRQLDSIINDGSLTAGQQDQQLERVLAKIDERELAMSRVQSQRANLLDAGDNQGTAAAADVEGRLRDGIAEFRQTDAFRQVLARGGHSASFEVEGLDLRAVLTAGTLGNTLGRPARPAEIVQTNADRGLRLLDVISSRPVNPGNGSTIEYIENTSAAGAGDTARETAEGTAKPEAVLALEVKTSTIATIAHWLDVTRQAFDDNTELVQIIRDRLFYGLLHRVDSQILNGNGTAPNLRGILNTSGINTYAPGAAEARVISVRKAFTLAQQDEYEPTVVILNPADWELVELSTDNDGMFRVSPSASNSLASRIWGKPAVITTAIAAGTALVGDATRGATLWERQTPILLTTDSDQDKFLKNILTLLAECRVGLTVERPAAWTKVTFSGTI